MKSKFFRQQKKPIGKRGKKIKIRDEKLTENIIKQKRKELSSLT